MKSILTLIVIAVLVVLFGALPLKVLGMVFERLAWLMNAISKAIDFFGFGGVI